MLSAENDDAQLKSVHGSILSLLRQKVEFAPVQTEVGNLQGHQDLKDLFDRLMFDPGLVQRIRYFADMLEMIEEKLSVLEPIVAQQRASEDARLAEADTETESEAESGSDNELPPSRRSSGVILFDSDDEDVPEGPYNPFAFIEDAATESETESELEDYEDWLDGIDNADSVLVSSGLRF
jgi:hypothetical protein